MEILRPKTFDGCNTPPKIQKSNSWNQKPLQIAALLPKFQNPGFGTKVFRNTHSNQNSKVTKVSGIERAREWKKEWETEKWLVGEDLLESWAKFRLNRLEVKGNKLVDWTQWDSTKMDNWRILAKLNSGI